jgi:tRNA (cmo5U34)-methyltransferase
MSEDRAVRDDVWKSDALVENFLSGVRGGIPYAADQIEIMLRMVAAGGRPVARFLDLGSGDGTLSAAILSRYPDAEAVLVDFSEPMMDAARRQLDSAISRHRFVLADFGGSDWSGTVADFAPFDLVVSGFAIHHQPDEGKRTVYRGVFELLAPGAFFINVEHVRPATPWLECVADELMIESIHAYHERTGTGKSHEQVARDHVHRPDKAANILTPVEEQCDWLREIGFEDVDCYFKVLELAVFGGRRPAS